VTVSPEDRGELAAAGVVDRADDLTLVVDAVGARPGAAVRRTGGRRACRRAIESRSSFRRVIGLAGCALLFAVERRESLLVV
jgi:hypothetical protein